MEMHISTDNSVKLLFSSSLNLRDWHYLKNLSFLCIFLGRFFSLCDVTKVGFMKCFICSFCGNTKLSAPLEKKTAAVHEKQIIMRKTSDMSNWAIKHPAVRPHPQNLKLLCSNPKLLNHSLCFCVAIISFFMAIILSLRIQLFFKSKCMHNKMKMWKKWNKICCPKKKCD